VAGCAGELRAPGARARDGRDDANQAQERAQQCTAVEFQDAYNPYQRAAAEVPAGGGTRRDLRKLSKWIKMMREIEERKVLDKEEAEKPREE
jgi:hypothetical protein